MASSSFKSFAVSVLKFATSSAVATLVDFCLFTFVLSHYLDIFYAEIISGFVGMTINFFLQKKYVFDLQRNQVWAFVLSIVFSFVGLFLGGLLMQHLAKMDLFIEYLFVAKLIVIGAKFIFNYFTKRWIFEKKGITGKELQR